MAVLEVGIAKTPDHVAFLDRADDQIPDKGSKQRINQDRDGLENPGDGNSLADSRHGHGVAHIAIGSCHHQVIGLIQREGSARPVADHEKGAGQAQNAAAGEGGQSEEKGWSQIWHRQSVKSIEDDVGDNRQSHGPNANGLNGGFGDIQRETR